MDWFTRLIALVSAIALLIELRMIRKALMESARRAPQPDESNHPGIPESSIPQKLKEIAEGLADRVVGPTLPSTLTEEEEFALEQRAHFTMGAKAGYQVMPWWVEQEEREAMEEEEARCSSASRD